MTTDVVTDTRQTQNVRDNRVDDVIMTSSSVVNNGHKRCSLLTVSGLLGPSSEAHTRTAGEILSPWSGLGIFLVLDLIGHGVVPVC